MNLFGIGIAGIAGLILGIFVADKTNVLSAFKEKGLEKYSFGRTLGAILCMFYLIPSGIKLIQTGVGNGFPDIPQNLALLIAGLFGITSLSGAWKK